MKQLAITEVPIVNKETYNAQLDAAILQAKDWQWPDRKTELALHQCDDWNIVLDSESRRIYLELKTGDFDPEVTTTLVQGSGLGKYAILAAQRGESFAEKYGRTVALAAMLELRCDYKGLSAEAVTVTAEILSAVLQDYGQATFEFCASNRSTSNNMKTIFLNTRILTQVQLDAIQCVALKHDVAVGHVPDRRADLDWDYETVGCDADFTSEVDNEIAKYN